MGDHDLELEKVRLLSIALDLGFDEESANKCLERLISLYDEDGRDFITVEHCGDDFLAALAESMQDTEDWDDLQAVESEASGALNGMLEKDDVYVDKGSKKGDAKSYIDIMEVDSSTDDEEFTIPKSKVAKSLSKPSSRPMTSKSGVTSTSSVPNKKQCSRASNHENRTLSYEELQALDDLELANVVIFGNRSFRPLQHKACKASLDKRD